MSQPTPKPLPPGTRGLPLLGETLPFLKDMFGFVSTRMAKHGGLFRSHVLGSPTVFMSGADANALWVETDNIQREGSFPKHVQEIFGGRSINVLDGDEHRGRKRLLLQAFGKDALETYVPIVADVVARRASEWAARGSNGGETRWVEELRALSVEGIAACFLGTKPGPELDALIADYKAVTAGMAALPVNLPGTAYKASLAARDRIMAFYAARIADRRRTPTGDGLSRMLAATGPDGATMTDDQVRLELHHVVIAGYIIFAELVAMILALRDAPAVRAKLEAELAGVEPGSAITLELLHRLPYLHRFVLEVKRHCPNIAVIFGKARRTFEFRGHTIPAGWNVMMAIRENNLDPSVFAKPLELDPDRFSPERREHEKSPHAYVPQGAGPADGHRCAGEDLSTLFMSVFGAILVRGYTWELPPQDLSLRWDVVPPEPRDGLRAVLRAL